MYSITIQFKSWVQIDTMATGTAGWGITNNCPILKYIIIIDDHIASSKSGTSIERSDSDMLRHGSFYHRLLRQMLYLANDVNITWLTIDETIRRRQTLLYHFHGNGGQLFVSVYRTCLHQAPSIAWSTASHRNSLWGSLELLLFIRWVSAIGQYN